MPFAGVVEVDRHPAHGEQPLGFQAHGKWVRRRPRPAREDALQRLLLLLACPFVEVEDPRPRRARLVVVVADRQGDRRTRRDPSRRRFLPRSATTGRRCRCRESSGHRGRRRCVGTGRSGRSCTTRSSSADVHSVAVATSRIYSGSAMAVVIASNLRKELAGIRPLRRRLVLRRAARPRRALRAERRRQDDAAADPRRRDREARRRARVREGDARRAARPAPAARAGAVAARVRARRRARPRRARGRAARGSSRRWRRATMRRRR